MNHPPSDPEQIPIQSDPTYAYSVTRGLRGKRVVVPDADKLIDKTADDLTMHAMECAKTRGAFHLALSGGSSPQPLYRRLMIDPRYRVFPWSRTHLWLADERAVEADDERSNTRLIRELIVDHSPIPRSQFHYMPATRSKGDEIYEQALREALGWGIQGGGPPRLDCVLLGMGADGHTASLFPHTPALSERERWVVFNDGPSIAAPRPRMTMTYPLLNAARRIALLVTGDEKHAPIQHISLAPDDVDRFPVTGIQPSYEDSELVWYLDHAAALGPGGENEPPP